MNIQTLAGDPSATPQPPPAQVQPPASPHHVMPPGMAPTHVLPARGTSDLHMVLTPADVALLHDALDELHSRAGDRARRLAIAHLSGKLDDAAFRSTLPPASSR